MNPIARTILLFVSGMIFTFVVITPWATLRDSQDKPSINILLVKFDDGSIGEFKDIWHTNEHRYFTQEEVRKLKIEGNVSK